MHACSSFAVVDAYEQWFFSWVFTHEVGHLIGGREHNMPNASFQYGHGEICTTGVSQGWCTLMGVYDTTIDWTMLERWSNPRQDTGGTAFGDSTWSDMVRVINERAVAMDSFRFVMDTVTLDHTIDSLDGGIVRARNLIKFETGFQAKTGSHLIAQVSTGFQKRRAPDKNKEINLTEINAWNFPNPFNPSTRIMFAIKEEGMVTLVINDVSGRQVRMLLSENKKPGMHMAIWDGKDGLGKLLPSGMYLYRFKTEKGILTKRMLLLK